MGLDTGESLAGVGIALPALDAPRRKAILDAVDSLAARLDSSSAVLALVLRFRLDMLAHPQYFYPIEEGSLPFLDEYTAASWLEVCLHFTTLVADQTCTAANLCTILSHMLHALHRASNSGTCADN